MSAIERESWPLLRLAHPRVNASQGGLDVDVGWRVGRDGRVEPCDEVFLERVRL